jgi:hypothetical protein
MQPYLHDNNDLFTSLNIANLLPVPSNTSPKPSVLLSCPDGYTSFNQQAVQQGRENNQLETYSLTATDTSNNTDELTFRVLWLDTKPPSITPLQPIQIQSQQAAFQCQSTATNDTTSIALASYVDVLPSFTDANDGDVHLRACFQAAPGEGSGNTTTPLPDLRLGCNPPGLGFVLRMNVSDFTGNAVMATVQVNVVDQVAPVVRLQQVASVVFGRKDPSTTVAFDEADGVLDNRTVTSTFDPWVLGNQSVRYCYTDSSNNTGCTTGQLAVAALPTISPRHLSEVAYYPQNSGTLSLTVLRNALAATLAFNEQDDGFTLYIVGVTVGPTSVYDMNVGNASLNKLIRLQANQLVQVVLSATTNSGPVLVRLTDTVIVPGIDGVPLELVGIESSTATQTDSEGSSSSTGLIVGAGVGIALVLVVLVVVLKRHNENKASTNSKSMAYHDGEFVGQVSTLSICSLATLVVVLSLLVLQPV